MRKMIAMLAALLCVMAAGAAAQGIVGTSASISASAQSISPHPVEPGQDFTLQLRLYNDGGTIATGITVTYEMSEVFTLTGKESSFDRPFSLCGGCTKDNIYYFTVSPDAQSGDYPLIFKIDDGSAVRSETIMVRVIGKPDVIFDALLLDEAVAPDSSFTARLTLRNVGTGVAKKIKLVPQTEGFVMENSNLLFIGNLRPGESITKDVMFMVSGDADAGPQKLVLDMDYTDEQSAEYSAEQSLGVRLLNKVELNIAAVTAEPQPVEKGRKTTVTVRVENLGEGKAEDIQVSLKNEGFEGQSKAYIGKLDEGEDAPAVFTLLPSKSGTHHFEVKVTYKDDAGSHELTEGLELLVVGKSLTSILLVIAAVAGVIYFVYAYFLKGKG